MYTNTHVIPGNIGILSDTGNPYITFSYGGGTLAEQIEAIFKDVISYFNGNSILYIRSLEIDIENNICSLRISN
jgi:hypothetical protein